MIHRAFEDFRSLNDHFDQRSFREFVIKHLEYMEIAVIKMIAYEAEFFDETIRIPKLMMGGYMILAIDTPAKLSQVLGKLRSYKMSGNHPYALVMSQENIREYSCEEIIEKAVVIYESIDMEYAYQEVMESEKYELDQLLDECSKGRRMQFDTIQRICHLNVQNNRWDALIVLIENGILTCPESYEYIKSYLGYLKSQGVEIPFRIDWRMPGLEYTVRDHVKGGKRHATYRIHQKSRD